MTADGSTPFAEKAQVWFPDDQHGYSIALCECDGGPYLGARQVGTPCICESCRRLTRDQWDFLVVAMTTPPALVNSWHCTDCGHCHTLNGCIGDPTPSDLWAGVSPAACDCDATYSPGSGTS